MCGILIWLNRNGNVKPNRFAKALHLQTNRGPDAQSMLFLKSPDRAPSKLYGLGDHLPDQNQMAAIGHTRLSILDPRPVANQPFISNDRRYCLVYNGEIYNYIEERERFSANEVFITSSDTEILFKALVSRGPSCLQTMNGMWAFGFMDFRENSLLLSRDPFGKKPLFYYSDSENFIVSSAIKSIYEILGTKRYIQQRALLGFLISKLTPTFDGGETLYKDIFFLPAGAILRFDLQNFSFNIQQNYDLNYWFQKEPSIDKFPMEIEEAVRIRLRSDVPIGVAISGGVDSSIVAAYATKHASTANPLTFFTIKNVDSLGKPKLDFQYSSLLSKELGFPLVEVEFPSEPDNVHSQLLHLIQNYELLPNINLITWPTYLLNKEISERGIKVVLDGTGGDEVLGGYPSMFATLGDNLASKRRVVASIMTLARWWKYKPGSLKNRVGDCLRLLELFITKGSNRTSPEHNVFTQLAPYLRNNDSYQEIHELIETFFIRYEAINTLDFQKFEIKNFLLPYALYSNDQLSMVWSLENRSPLLDINLVKYINVHDNQKIKYGFNKYFLRQAFPHPVPSAVRWRRDKEGMSSNPTLFTKFYRELIRNNVLSSDLVKDVVDIVSVEKHIDQNMLPDVILRGLFTLSLLDESFECSLA